MKKRYLAPQVEVNLITIERNFLASDRVGSSSTDFDVEDIEAVWE